MSATRAMVLRPRWHGVLGTSASWRERHSGTKTGVQSADRRPPYIIGHGEGVAVVLPVGTTAVQPHSLTRVDEFLTDRIDAARVAVVCKLGRIGRRLSTTASSAVKTADNMIQCGAKDSLVRM